LPKCTGHRATVPTQRENEARPLKITDARSPAGGKIRRLYGKATKLLQPAAAQGDDEENETLWSWKRALLRYSIYLLGGKTPNKSWPLNFMREK
jgi:hypothetical protein